MRCRHRQVDSRGCQHERDGEAGCQEAGGEDGQRFRQRRHRRTVGDDHRQPAEVEHAGQGHDEGGDAEASDPEALPGAHGQAAGERGQDGEARVDVVLHGQYGQDHADQRHRRADREVEVAADDQHHRADRREADDRGLQGQQDQVALGQERTVGLQVEEHPDDREHEQQRQVPRRAKAPAEGRRGRVTGRG